MAKAKGHHALALSANFKALLLVIMWGCHMHLVGAQNNGDVRLVHADPGSPSYDKATGRLEIYIDHVWYTFCNTDDFKSTAADAACRQLGYLFSDETGKASDFPDIPLAEDSTKILITSMSCHPDIGAMHILRCVEFEDNASNSLCTHNQDVILQCSDRLLTAEGYDTQLYLNSHALKSVYPSVGVLEIYSSKSQAGALAGWHNICGTKFDKNAANSACRQLGYTRALLHSTHASHSRKTVIWLDGVTCGAKAHNCLDSCFCYPRMLTAVQCDPHRVVSLSCAYDLNEADTKTAGSRNLCEEEQKTYCVPETPTGVTTGTHTKPPHPNPNPNPGTSHRGLAVLGSKMTIILIVTLIVVIVVLLVLMFLRRGRVLYQTLN